MTQPPWPSPVTAQSQYPVQPPFPPPRKSRRARWIVGIVLTLTVLTLLPCGLIGYTFFSGVREAKRRVEDERKLAMTLLEAPTGQIVLRQVFEFADGDTREQGMGFLARTSGGRTVVVTSSHFLDFDGPAMVRARWFLDPFGDYVLPVSRGGKTDSGEAVNAAGTVGNAAQGPVEIAQATHAVGAPGKGGVMGGKGSVPDLRTDYFVLRLTDEPPVQQNLLGQLGTGAGSVSSANSAEGAGIKVILNGLPAIVRVLELDPRGLPGGDAKDRQQGTIRAGEGDRGERVWLPYVDILTGDREERKLVGGRVIEAMPKVLLVELDEDAPLIAASGSPLISQHTGKVIGLLTAATKLDDKPVVLAAPIGPMLVMIERAEKAKDDRPLVECVGKKK